MKGFHIDTLSGPGVVRIEIRQSDAVLLAFIEGTPEEAESTAYAILDSARRAREKARLPKPIPSS